MIIFDDTFEHEAWAIPDVQDNETQSGKGFAPTDRLILIIDTWMPSIVERDRVNGIIMGKFLCITRRLLMSHVIYAAANS